MATFIEQPSAGVPPRQLVMESVEQFLSKSVKQSIKESIKKSHFWLILKARKLKNRILGSF